MSDVWAKIEKLAGQKLETLSQEKVFTVTEVSDGKVYFVPEGGTGTRRYEPKAVFEKFAAQDWARTDLRPSRVAQEYEVEYGLATQNSSYIAAILKKALEP